MQSTISSLCAVVCHCSASPTYSSRCRHVLLLLLLCFSNHVLSLRCRRRVLPLSFFYHLLCCCFMIASEPLFKFITSSLDFVESFLLTRELGQFQLMLFVSCIVYCSQKLLSDLRRSKLHSFLTAWNRKCAVTDLWSPPK